MRRRRTVYDRRDIHLLASVEREKKSKETTNQKKNRMGEKKGPFFFRQPRFPDDRCPPPPPPRLPIPLNASFITDVWDASYSILPHLRTKNENAERKHG